MLRNTFLYKVFKRDKALFILFNLFIAGQLFFTYKHVENTPFFHFGMYSAIHQFHESYTVYDISVAGTTVKSLDFPDYQREVVYNTIACYYGLKQMDFRDSLDEVITHRLSGIRADYAREVLLNTRQMDTPYQKWLFQYIADMRLINTPEIEVRRHLVVFLPDGAIAAPDSSHLLFRWKYE
jgi:hypothetical protein